MESYIKYLTEEEITNLDIKQLNKILKLRNISKIDQLAIKHKRRSNKMKKYRKDSRIRTSFEKLQAEKRNLKSELLALLLEVDDLNRCKENLISMQERYDSDDDDDDDDEYGEILVVD